MKVIMLAVSSANGKITKGQDSDIYKWTSAEDQDFFFSKIRDAKLIVMGSGTYMAMRDRIKKDPGRLRIVLTSNPAKFKEDEAKGILEFRSGSPKEIVAELSNYDELILAGGSTIYSTFAKEGLIDEIYLTIEPLIFGSGKPLFSESEVSIKLKLETIKKLNEKGTLLLKYIVEK